MSNIQMIHPDKKSLISLAKFLGFAALLVVTILWSAGLSANGQRNDHGNGNGNGNDNGNVHGNGPGPQHQPGGHMNHGDSGFGNYYGVENLAYYGDWNSNRVFIINVDEMSLLKTVENTGDGPYGVDQQNAASAYALTRKTESLTVIENYYIENIGKIFLTHKPRSTNFNPETGFSLVSGADKVMTSMIKANSDQVVKIYGFDELTYPHDFGGSLATGHPLWLDNHRFFMIDRAARQIQLWSRQWGLLSVLNTPTSVHHVFQSPLEGFDDIYYAVAEGNQEESISPSILRFRIHHGQMAITGQAILSSYDHLALDPAVMGSHHADFHPNGVHIYIGSAEGHVFVVNKDSMEIVTMIETGLGSGHTTFVPLHDVAFVTNHYDTYMTVIDTTDHSRKMNIEVALSAPAKYKTQAHTSAVSPDQAYFYSAASYDGLFFEIDVENLYISGFVDIESEIEEDVNILMGSFIWDSEGDGM